MGCWETLRDMGAMLGKRWEMSKQNVGEEGHHEDTKREHVCLGKLKNISDTK
jgi:hypothetical protein